jgi:hypothetical protein
MDGKERVARLLACAAKAWVQVYAQDEKWTARRKDWLHDALSAFTNATLDVVEIEVQQLKSTQEKSK